MLAFPVTALLATLAAVSRVAAAPEPTSPDSSTVVNVGSDITALWNADTAGNWTDMTIQLMTGANLAMVPLVTVARNVDATTLESYSFAAPDVSPNAAIYFLQFTSSNDPSETLWTTRFTIAAADGTTTEPTNSTTTDGTTVQWGTGTLNAAYDITSSSASAASDASSTAAATSSSSSSAPAASSLVTSASAAASSASAPVSVASSAAAAASSSGTSGANKVMAVSAGAVVGLAGVVAALL